MNIPAREAPSGSVERACRLVSSVYCAGGTTRAAGGIPRKENPAALVFHGTVGGSPMAHAGKLTPREGAGMTARERSDLAVLVRQRERVAKRQAEHRSAELLAEFERQIAAVYHFDQSSVWKEATERAERAVEAANKQIAEECRALGIPRQFAPRLDLEWYRRGENAAKERRVELRKAAEARIKERELAAKAAIERASLEVQTQLLADGLTTDAAKVFLERMPEVSTLMPPLDVAEVKALLPGPDGQGES